MSVWDFAIDRNLECPVDEVIALVLVILVLLAPLLKWARDYGRRDIEWVIYTSDLAPDACFRQAALLITAEMSKMGLIPRDDLDPDLKDLRSFYCEHGRMWFLVVNEEVLGTCALRIDSDGKGAELRRFYVAPGARGKGIGSRLFQCARNHGRGVGLSHLWASAVGGSPSVSLYLRWGFTLVPLPDNVARAERADTVRLDFSLLERRRNIERAG